MSSTHLQELLTAGANQAMSDTAASSKEQLEVGWVAI